MNQNFFIHSSVKGYFGCFYILATVNSAAMNKDSAFFMVQHSHTYMTAIKTIALTIQTFVDQVMSLLCNMLSRLVVALLPRNKCLFILWLQSPSTVILEHKKIKPVTVFHCFPIYLL